MTHTHVNWLEYPANRLLNSSQLEAMVCQGATVIIMSSIYKFMVSDCFSVMNILVGKFVQHTATHFYSWAQLVDRCKE